MISNAIPLAIPTTGKMAESRINASALSTSYAMLAAEHTTEISTTEKSDTETQTTETNIPELSTLFTAFLPLNSSTHKSTATTNHLTSAAATIKQTTTQPLLTEMNTGTKEPTSPLTALPHVKPLTQTPYSQANANLSLGSATQSQVNSTTTSSLPITAHLAATSVKVNTSGEHNTICLPLSLSDPKAMESVEGTNSLLGVSTRPQSQVSQWGPVPITPTALQAQELLSPLREQLRFQIDQHIKKAELRLDPPELGKVELSIRLDGDRLHIQIHAANTSVRDSLMIGLDRLRAELAMDHGGQIDVDVGQGDKKEQAPNHDGTRNMDIAKQNNGRDSTNQHKPQTSNGVDLLA